MSGPSGVLRLIGQLTEASNQTFLAVDENERRWVYKPVSGEAPLWDFPDSTLGRREVAAYALSEALGLDVVPLTVWCDGPLGEGSAQAWIDAAASGLVQLVAPDQLTPQWHPIVGVATSKGEQLILAHRDDARLRRVALFDVIVNNADRKASHLIGDPVRGVDHGVSLHVEPKLRTILWGWAGEPLTDAERALVERARAISEPLAPGLADEEWEAMVARAAQLFSVGEMPHPAEGRPAIPWPPF